MTRENLNHIELVTQHEGNERRYDMERAMLENDTFIPKTLEYSDIDDAFNEWVKGLEILTDDGTEFPTMSLFSNQRFSEYSQSWKYTDNNNNLLLNFKTVKRENNPKYGKIQTGLWNIPGDRFYTMKKVRVLDDNGTESYRYYSMKQPTAIDFAYKVSIFTNKYQKLNEFNTLINKLFSSKQCYICPNGHYIPMTLENISDESEYNIDDRQFYSQTYDIIAMGYIITEDDYRVSEVPLKLGVSISGIKIKKAEVEIEELDTDKYGREPLKLDMLFKKGVLKTDFTSDTDFLVETIDYENAMPTTKVFINGDKIDTSSNFMIYEYDNVRVIPTKMNPNLDTKITFNGYNPNNIAKNL